MVNQFPIRTPKRFAPFTRPIPAANSGLRRPVSAASCASRRTAAKRTLMVEGARFFCSRKYRLRRTTVRLKAKRGSEQYQTMNSSMACAYDSCELAAASEFRTAFFDCSKSGKRSIVFGRERLLVFFRRPILAASCAAFSMVIHLEARDPNPVSEPPEVGLKE